MRRLSKTHPGGEEILEDISLSFFPDAKVGIVGINGAGRSTLLEIMAGEPEEFTGEAWAAEAIASATCGRSRGSTPSDTQLPNSKSSKFGLAGFLRALEAVWRFGSGPTSAEVSARLTVRPSRAEAMRRSRP